MLKHNQLFIFVAILIIVCGLVMPRLSLADGIKTPTIVEMNKEGVFDLEPVFLTGFTQPNTEVLVYVDGNYDGMAEVNVEGTETDNFYYMQPKMKLSSGWHKVQVLSRDKTSLVLSPFSEEKTFYLEPLTAPTLISPNEATVTGMVKPIIVGLSKSGTMVHIYIDGIYNGKTDILIHESGTASFAYKPFLNLSVGDHEIFAIAENSAGVKSKTSKVLRFTIEEPLPAPIISKPVVNNNTTFDKPFVVGVAKNDLNIKIFIDHKLDGELNVGIHESGTASFAYKPFQKLTAGKHFVYTVAVDSRGKESVWSNIEYFSVGTVQPSITSEAAEEVVTKSTEYEETGIEITEPEKENSKAKIVPEETMEEEPAKEEPAKEEPKVIKELEEQTEDGGEVVDEDIKKLLKETPVEEDKTGAIDESKEGQTKLQLNLIIFILFLLAVIIWIFWVNRELIKERQAQSKDEKNKK